MAMSRRRWFQSLTDSQRESMRLQPVLRDLKFDFSRKGYEGAE